MPGMVSIDEFGGKELSPHKLAEARSKQEIQQQRRELSARAAFILCEWWKYKLDWTSEALEQSTWRAGGF